MNLDTVLENYVHGSFSKPDNDVFHYTSPASLKKILSSRYLKLHSHKIQNHKADNRELKCAYKCISSELVKRAPEYLPIYYSYMANSINVYTVSFCENPKSQHAIKTYGPCCIKFKAQFFKAFENNTHLTFFSSVEYNLPRQRLIIKEMFDFWEECRKVDITSLMVWLSLISPLFKENKDNVDEECRLVGIEVWKNNKLLTPKILEMAYFTGNDIEIC